MERKRYALCGLSNRGMSQFVLPILGRSGEGAPSFADRAELVGLLDLDAERVRIFQEKMGTRIPFYPHDAEDRMIRETRPDVVIAVAPDSTHCDHTVCALEAGCDVITEKPMVIDCGQARRVRAAERKSGRRVSVAFNYRYTELHRAMKRMIRSGKLGRVISVEFTYNLDTFHGASYFYRWNRRRDCSGGLSIHKGSHHFDLVNWWLDDLPEEVFAFGGLNYYGEHGALRPRDGQGLPLDPVEEKRRCPYFRKHYADRFKPEEAVSTGWDALRLPYRAQYPDDRPRYIYDREIDIEDTYAAVVRYRKGTVLNYSCNFSTPWEGYILGINGTAGRAEVVSHTLPEASGGALPIPEVQAIVFYPLFGGREVLEVPTGPGGHGGADFVIQRDLLDRLSDESAELNLVAGSREGAAAIAIGEGIHRSVRSHQPVRIAELLGEDGV
jgi:predicted dehydrogenase